MDDFEQQIDADPVDQAKTVLAALAQLLEDSGYAMAGHVDSTQVARVLALSHEVTVIANRLRSANL